MAASAKSGLGSGDANRIPACDTDAFATVIWREWYYHSRGRQVDAIGGADRVGTYFLTATV